MKSFNVKGGNMIYTIPELFTIIGVIFATGVFCYALYIWINK